MMFRAAPAARNWLEAEPLLIVDSNRQLQWHCRKFYGFDVARAIVFL
jgi:hypothetical protein